MSTSSSINQLLALLQYELAHWHYYAHISASINFRICRHFMVRNSHEHIIEAATEVDQFIARNSQSALIWEWTTSLLFNVAAMNDQYVQEISEYASQKESVSSKSLEQKLNEDCCKVIELLLNMQTIQQFISSKSSKEVSNSPMISTINYLASKFGLEQKIAYYDQLHLILDAEGYEQGQSEPSPQVMQFCNGLLFKEQKMEGEDHIGSLQQKLESNYNANLTSFASLIDANYYKYEMIRSIFKVEGKQGGNIDGCELLTKIYAALVKSYNKNELFSQKMCQADRLFQLALTVLEYRHCDVYVQWLSIISNAHVTDKLRKDIHTFWQQDLPVNYPQFIVFLRTLYQQIVKKHSPAASTEIMKKFVFNRFLLSPDLYMAMSTETKNKASSQPAQEQLAAKLNNIRLLFHPKKLESSLKETGNMFHSIFQKLISSSLDKSISIENNEGDRLQYKKNTIYRLDKHLHRDYLSLYADMNSHHSQNLQNKDVSLSFSFLKNNASLNYLSQTNRSPDSIRILENVKSKPALQSYNSPTSIKSRKTVHTEYSEHPATSDCMVMINELVNLRRQLGATRMKTEQANKRRREKRIKWMSQFEAVHCRFQQLRRNLQLNAAYIKMDVDMM